jgi:hypothetical protein
MNIEVDEDEYCEIRVQKSEKEQLSVLIFKA